jgi:hypothetical protein
MAEASSTDAAHGTVAFLAELIRLQRRVHLLDRQLDALEAGMRRALNDLAREVYETSR